MMTANPYAKKLGASSRQQAKELAAAQQATQDLYTFDPSAAANDLIAATIGASSGIPSGGGGAGYGMGMGMGMDASQRQPTAFGGVPGTASGMVPGGSPELPRPMTSARGAGYSSAGAKSGPGMGAGRMFDPLGQGSAHGPAPPLERAMPRGPEWEAKEMEKRVHALIEASAAFLQQKPPNTSAALARAREAEKAEAQLRTHRQERHLADQQNYDLTFAALLHLSNAYMASKMYEEAWSVCERLVPSPDNPPREPPPPTHLIDRVRVNKGNIRFAQKRYPAAIKQYRIALDKLAAANAQGQGTHSMRFKIQRNIGLAFLKLGRFQDAIHNFEVVMENAPEAQTAFNLLVCYYALGDRERMREGFVQMLTNLPELAEQQAEDEAEASEQALAQAKKQAALAGGGGPSPTGSPSSAAGSGSSGGGVVSSILSPLGSDKSVSSVLGAADDLRLERKARRKVLQRYISMAARLVAPVVEKDLAAGFDWVISQLKQPRSTKKGGHGGGGGMHSMGLKNGFPSVALELEIAKGIAFLKRRPMHIAAAIDVFKGVERMDYDGGNVDGLGMGGMGSPGSDAEGAAGGVTLDPQAATNLACLYFLESDLATSEKYAEAAVRADRYNAKALVNKANALMLRGSLIEAKELYLEAIGVEADCVEAIYNLGLANKKLATISMDRGDHDSASMSRRDAMQAFRKLHRILPRDTQVLWQLAVLAEAEGEVDECEKFLTKLLLLVPSDPKVLARLGSLHAQNHKETEAFENFADSYAAYPANMEVISWLGVWFVKSGQYELAVPYFSRAAEIEPQEIKWQLMVASCYRRMEDYKQALRLYKKIHMQNPENVECLRYLCMIAKEHGTHAEYEEYTKALQQAEREAKAREMEQQAHQQQYHQQQYPAEGEGHQEEGYPHHQQQQHQQHNGRNDDIGAPQPASGVMNLADGFRPEIAPSTNAPTFNVGSGAGNDEWGEGLGEDLLP